MSPRDPVTQYRLMGLSDRQLEQAVAHRLVHYWSYVAQHQLAALQGMVWGLGSTFASGFLAAAAWVGPAPLWAIPAGVVSIAAGSVFALRMVRFRAAMRGLPDMSAMQPILDEMKRRQAPDSLPRANTLREP